MNLGISVSQRGLGKLSETEQNNKYVRKNIKLLREVHYVELIGPQFLALFLT